MNGMFISAEERLGTLSREREELLQLLLEQKLRKTQQITSYPRGEKTGTIRVQASWAQRRLWFIDQLEGSSATYHIAMAMRLKGDLNEEALKNALDTLMQRHEALRTVFVVEDGDPQQEFVPQRRFSLCKVDLSDYDKVEREAQIRRQKMEEALGRFDLAAGPLIRGRLLRLQANEHVLLITMHHIVSDGWSMGVLIRELVQLYKAYREGRDDPLEPLPIQYADYAQWQRQRLQGVVLEKQLSYWRAHLKGAAPQLELPTDRPRPAVQSYRGANVGVLLDAPLSAKLKTLAQRYELTLFMVLYAGWAILLSRLSGQEDVVIGTPVANRDRPELERLIGFFANTLVLRVGVHSDSRMEDFLDQVKRVTRGAIDHQEMPFEQLVEALQPQRSLSRNPLFQVMFTLQNAPKTEPRLPGLSATMEDGADEPATFDLLLSLEERRDEIVGSLNYATDLFDRETVERWISSFKVVLRGMADDAPSHIGDLPILHRSERHQVIVGFNATQAPYPQEQLLHALVEQQVQRTPHAVAVLYEGQCLTYAELNGRANRLARHLRSFGLTPDQLVGICLERSLEMVVGLLGILKAGCAYVPLDPSNPTERLAYMLKDAGPQVLLTQDRLRSTLPTTAAHVIALDSGWSEIAVCADGNLDPCSLKLTSRNLAYVIYTSGSTGAPKGAMNEHRGVVNRLLWMQDRYRLDCHDRVLQKTPFSFDVSVWEFFWTLMSGAQLIVARAQGHQDPVYLRKLIEQTGVTTLHFVPSMLQAFLEQHQTGACPSVRHVVCSGEELSGALQDRCLNSLPHARLSNLYGPTEAAVDVTAWECQIEEHGSRVPIGQPIANIQMYVLDRHRQPVPIGVTGEIYIGGVGVGRGYLNRPELTAERFLPDPFSVDPQARLYRTGDVGRWRADGALEYLGRNDDQVKLRGNRIELGEIAAQLARHEKVKEAVVIAREDAPGEKRLVAYVVPPHQITPSVDELRTHLKTILPEYMLPSAFVILKSLPLSPNGKLDRRALPAPELNAYVSREYEAPQGEVEEILAGIWQKLLRVQRVGRHDNFFELGGHSLLIVQMMEQLRRVGLPAEIRCVFESPSLAVLAHTLLADAATEYEVPPNLIPPSCEAITPEMLPLVDIEPEHVERIVRSILGGAPNIQDIYPLVPLQEGILFHHLLNEGADTYVLPALLLLPSREGLLDFIAALQQVIDRHDVLRTAVLWENLPQPLQVVCRRATLPVVEVVLDQRATEQIREWMKPERQRLDLRQAPLMRLQVAADPHSTQWYALLQTHHLICDHESLEIIFAEVLACLEGRGRLLSEPMPYRNHVAQALAHAQMHDAEAFFRGKFAEIDEPTIPFGLLDVHGDGIQIAEAHEELEPILCKRVRTQARRLSVSAASVFHAAWALVVAHTSGRDEAVFGTVLLGRLQGSAGAQPILGMFINTLPLRLRLQDVTAIELMEQTQRELVELLGHEQASLAVAQRCSSIAGSAPLFSALLNYRHSVPNTEAEASIASRVRVLAVQDRSNYPITLSVDDLGEGFELTAKTDRSIDPRRLTAYLRTAMQSLVEALENAPHTPAFTLSIMPKPEQHLVIAEFNATQAPYPQDILVHELFEQQVQRTPHAVALEHEGHSLTYADLNARANQLAWYLRTRGVGPEARVGLCVERSPEMVVGLMGIWKAGGAYVPLDPDYPTERLANMLGDAAPEVVLTQQHLQARLQDTVAEVIALDRQWHEIARSPTSNLDPKTLGVCSEHLAYVIYTSGSTGAPKGVMVEHRQVTSLWQSLEQLYGQSAPCQRIGVNASFTFDASVKQLIQLLSGRTLVLIPQPLRWDAPALLRFIEEQHIEGIDCTPSQLRAWIGAGLLKECARQLRLVLVGGESIDAELWSQLAQCTHTDFYNVYGPTESTVDTTFARLRGDMSVPHIGRPMENRQVYLLDRHGQPVPLGVAGEIYIGGPGVARGYLNRPDLTSERFIADPYSAAPQARLYKSGDLGRWRADGILEYLGRNDAQVKIRGFRIELGEIEAQLARHESVKEAVVVAREDVPGEPRLVAYFTQRDEGTSNAAALRAHLKALLPDYMVPSAFVLLERLPLTPSGKLDRRALPAPELDAYISRNYEPPQGEVEEILVGIWQKLLGVERIGRNDNFFELGGHSLLIVRMMELLRRVGLSTEIRRVFESPTLADLASALTSAVVGQFEVPPNLIPPECNELLPQMLPLVQLQPEHIERVVQATPGGAANIQDIYPLAPLQEGLLFHHLLNEQSGDTYVLSTLLSVCSRERLDELIAALQEVIDRHDVFRTAVLWEHLPTPIQVVQRHAILPVNEIVLARDRDPAGQVGEWIKPERQRLDLRQAPLMRLQVAADPHAEHWYALLQLHHMVCDHVTAEVVASEVVAHLERRGQRLPQTVPYRNHVAQALAHAQMHDAEVFFRGKLAEIDETTAPFGLLDVHGDGSRIEEAREEFEPTLSQRVRTQARRLSVSAATVFHAAWALVVAHTSGRDEVVFGSLLLGRLQGSAGAQRILGMFINTLPLRLRLQGVTTKELVEQTQRELVELLGHEQASLAVAQRCSGIVGSAPLFSALLNYRHSVPNPEAEWTTARGIRELAHQGRTNYPLTVSVDDLGEGFLLTAQTDRSIDPHRMTGYLRTAVQSLVEALEKAPHTPALTLSIMPKPERHLVIAEFNATQAPYPQDRLVHELFEQQVQRTPHAVALEHEGHSLTYADLNARANQLAWYLRTRGVGPDARVGLCVERSPEMVVGLLGVLKAGAAYLPLDPNYPSERLAYMLGDAAPQVVLTQQVVAALLPATPAERIMLDALPKQVARYLATNLPASELGLRSEHLVYVIYTSGSTGRPKGTAMAHRSMANLIEWHRSSFGAGEGRRVLQYAALSFDVAFQETFSTLCTGGTLVLLNEWIRKDGRALAEFLIHQSIDRIFLPPLMLQNLAEHARATGAVPGSLQDVICAGEQLRITPEISALFQQLPNTRLHNHYGPTETHVVTAHTLSGQPGEWPAVPPIGRPIANSQIYLLSHHLQPVPIGVAGEICIGGAGVAHGYLNRPELTIQRFIADPFSVDPQARLYRTGDLGRWRADGTLEYVGRNDDQVKLRGFRIELGEIEAQIASHETVKEAVVVAREDAPGEKRLVAYITPRESEPSVEKLRAHLKVLLPEFMVPSAFVILERLPLTPSGKLNRRALPAPTVGAYVSEQYEPPQGEVERTLACIWQELLLLERVGRHDNFFELGGHSLLAVKLIVQVAERLRVNLAIPAVFRYSTVRQMAEVVESLRLAHEEPAACTGMELEQGLI